MSIGRIIMHIRQRCVQVHERCVNILRSNAACLKKERGEKNVVLKQERSSLRCHFFLKQKTAIQQQD